MIFIAPELVGVLYGGGDPAVRPLLPQDAGMYYVLILANVLVVMHHLQQMLLCLCIICSNLYLWRWAAQVTRSSSKS